MTKNEFLMELAVRIQKLTDKPGDIYEELRQMIKFYDEIITDKVEDGMTEEEAVAAIDSIDDIIERQKSEIQEKMPEDAPEDVPADVPSVEAPHEVTNAVFTYEDGTQKYCEYSGGVINKIVVRDANCSMNIMHGRTVAVNYCDNAEGHYEITAAGGVLQVNFVPSAKGFFGFFRFSGRRKPLVIEVPTGWEGILDAQTHNAKIGIDAKMKEIYLCTSNASIDIACAAADMLRANTSNGRIYVEYADCGRAEFKTSNGKIDATDVTAAEYVKMITSNGNVKVQNIVSQNISLVTSNGAITGSLPGRMEDYAITGETSNGKNNLPTGTAGSKKLDVRTSNGKISIDFADDY